MWQQGSPSSLAQSPSPSAHFSWDKRVYHRSSQEQTGFGLVAPLSHMERSLLGCWKHQENPPPFEDNMELAAKLLGSAPLWLQQGPTTPGSRLRGQSSFLAQDVPHIPAQNLHLATGCRGQRQVLGVPGAGTTSMVCFPPQKLSLTQPPPQQGECSGTNTINTMK